MMDDPLGIIAILLVGIFVGYAARPVTFATFWNARIWYGCTTCGWTIRNRFLMRLHVGYRKHHAVRYAGKRR